MFLCRINNNYPLLSSNTPSYLELCLIQVLPFVNNSKDLNPSYKMELDFFNCFGRKKKTLSTDVPTGKTLPSMEYLVFGQA